MGLWLRGAPRGSGRLALWRHCVSSPPPAAWSLRPGVFALLYECTSGHSGDSVTEVTSASSFCGGFSSDIFRANKLRVGGPDLRGPREAAGLRHTYLSMTSSQKSTLRCGRFGTTHRPLIGDVPGVKQRCGCWNEVSLQPRAGNFQFSNFKN